MAVDLLKPKRGGFLRPFGCGEFIREFLLGKGPYGSELINPSIGAPQSTIFRQYKLALIKATALDRATRIEEKRARKENRAIDPDNIEKLAETLGSRMPYNGSACRYHSFIVYFSTLRKLKWVELTGRKEASEFQDRYAEGQPRKYYRLTVVGKAASEHDWGNPRLALYHY
jgi:hypothetical protein